MGQAISNLNPREIVEKVRSAGPKGISFLDLQRRLWRYMASDEFHRHMQPLTAPGGPLRIELRGRRRWVCLNEPCPECHVGTMLPPVDGKRVCDTCGFEKQ